MGYYADVTGEITIKTSDINVVTQALQYIKKEMHDSEDQGVLFDTIVALPVDADDDAYLKIAQSMVIDKNTYYTDCSMYSYNKPSQYILCLSEELGKAITATADYEIVLDLVEYAAPDEDEDEDEDSFVDDDLYFIYPFKIVLTKTAGELDISNDSPGNFAYTQENAEKFGLD